MEELDLEIFLKNYKSRSVDFFRFPGNYGDSLIWHGTKKLLSLFNISETYVDILSEKNNDTLFIDGGGNFVDYYSDVRNFLIKKSSLYKEIVILPHTIFGDKQVDVLNHVNSKLTIFCREKISANFLTERINSGEIYLWHDCAFYNKFESVSSGLGTLNVFRSDKESTLSKLPEDNIDLSYNGYAQKPLGELINKINQYNKINTDRLHVGICATLLGKQVNLFTNSYYKNKAVYDYSLRQYTNVKFFNNYNEIKP